MRLVVLLFLFAKATLPITEEALQVSLNQKPEAMVIRLKDNIRHLSFSAHLPKHNDRSGKSTWANVSVICRQRDKCTVRWVYFYFSDNTISAVAMDYDMKIRSWSDTELVAADGDDESITVQFGTLLRVYKNSNTYQYKAFINDEWSDQPLEQRQLESGTWVIK